jgi:uncharacterized membrane protein
MSKLARVGFGLAVLTLGITHLVFGVEVGRMFVMPPTVPARDLLVRLAGVVLALSGGAMLADKRAREAGLATATLMLVAVVTLHLPRAIPSGTFGGAWIGVLKWVALAGGAALAAGMRPAFARWAMAALMIGSAVAHVRFTEFVVTMIPEWMPWRTFWALFAGATLGAGGVGLVVPKVARLAGQLSAAMFLGFFVLVHVPRMLADPAVSLGWAELGESLAYAAISWMLAQKSSRTSA